MKIAVLISGEYRTFGLCRKTMSFLDDPRVDVYFSTWDKTIYDMPKLGFYKCETVTQTQIEQELGLPVTIEIENAETFVESRYNSKMIHRWKRGINLIKNSGVEYNFVLITRPDLMFCEKIQFPYDMEQYRTKLGSGWHYDNSSIFLNDVMLLSSYENIKRLFDSLSINMWTSSGNTDWHSWWHSFVFKFFNKIEDLPMAKCTFCRPWVTNNSTLAEVQKFQEDWHNIKILQICDIIGRENATAWPADVLARAYQKWELGDYNKYINIPL